MADEEEEALRLAQLERSHRAIAELLSVAMAHGLVSDDGAAVAHHAVILRDDTAEQAAAPEPEVDCVARLPVCRAACCRLAVRLSAAEVEGGKVRWDTDRPYLLRRESDGRCTHQDRDTLLCGVYADRPKPCRRYSCANDRRIWRDFDGWVLNTEWLEANLGPDEPPLIQLQPLARHA